MSEVGLQAELGWSHHERYKGRAQAGIYDFGRLQADLIARKPAYRDRRDGQGTKGGLYMGGD